MPGIKRRAAYYLMPFVFSCLLPLFMIPATTYALDPEDFGLFALASSLAGLGAALSSMGSNLLLSAHFPVADRESRRQLLSTLLLSAMATALLFSILFLALRFFPFIGKSVIEAVPWRETWLSLGAMLFSVPWLIVGDVLVLEGNSRFFATITISQSLATASATLLSLYGADMGRTSLFIGSCAGALVGCIGAMVVAKPYFRLAVSSIWMKRIFKIGSLSSLGNFAESLQTALERSLLSVHAGMGQLGLYNHSQQYRTMLMALVKAVSRSIWPVTLEESRMGAARFEKTILAWSAIHLALISIGLGFVTLGRYVLEWLSHGKFTEAYSLVVLWVVYLAFKHLGRAELGHLVAMGHGRFLSLLSLVSCGIGIASLFILIPRLGVIGCFLAVYLQDLTYRIGLSFRARKLRPFRFHEFPVLFGSGILIAALWVSRRWDFTWVENLALLVVLEAVLCAFVFRKTLAAMAVHPFFSRPAAAKAA